MKKAKTLTITYKYVGNESPEKRKESEGRLDRAYDIIFGEAFRNLNERSKTNKL